jgi:hypothetical protein
MKILKFICLTCLITGLSPFLYATEPTIKVGIISQPSLFFVDKSGLIQGFYVGLLKDFALKEKIKISLNPVKPEEIQSKLETNEFEIVIGLEQTPELTRQLDFSKQSLNSVWGMLYVHESYGIPIHTIFDLHGRKIAIKKDDPKANGLKNLCDQFKINCSFKTVDSYQKV